MPVEGRDENGLEGDGALILAPLGDGKDPALRLVEDGRRVARLIIAEADDIGGGGDHRAQDGFFLDDAGVVLDVGRGRHGIGQTREIADAPDLFELVPAAQVIRDRDEVHRFGPVGQGGDGVPDDAVGLAVEIVGGQDLLCFEDGFPLK